MSKILKSLSGINYWDTAPYFDLGYTRSGYLRKLEKDFGNKLIKVIVGQRRAGKSYIVRQLISMLINEKNIAPVNLFYINMEMFEFEDIRTAADLSELIHLFEEQYAPKGKLYIFIDEVQNISNWEKIIVSLAQHPVKQYELLITGSNSRILSSELATFLSGRYILTEVFPFSYKEFLEYKSLENNKGNLIKYMSTSALPEIFHLEHTETRRHYLQSLKDTILLKDIMQRHQIRDFVLLEDVFLFLLHNVGNMTSVPSIVKYYKTKKRKADYSTISTYISYMEEAFIIHKVPRYSLKTKALLSGEKKYFINDLGFRNYLYPHLMEETGVILENLVFMHLKMKGMEIQLGYNNNCEVDFIAKNEVETSYIQVSYIMATQRTIDREFGALEKIDDNFPKYVVSMDDLLIHSQKGIIHQHIWDYIYSLCE